MNPHDLHPGKGHLDCCNNLKVNQWMTDFGITWLYMDESGAFLNFPDLMAKSQARYHGYDKT
jgi:hypothetical protein